MKNNTPQDIVKKTRKEKEGILEQMSRKKQMKKQRGRRNSHFKWMNWKVLSPVFLLIILLIFFLYPVSADVKVFPKQEFVDIEDKTINISPAPSSGLAFEVMSLGLEKSRDIELNVTENRRSRASGQITIYNEFSPQSQRLITNTRFETPDGLIYRIHEPVEVPGYTQDGEEIIPGSINVDVFADEPGQEYNIEETDFTIPGFEDMEQFNHFYASSVTEKTGGFDGQVYTIEQDRFNQLYGQMISELEDELRETIKKETPNGFISFDQLLFFDSSVNEGVPISEDQDYTLTMEREMKAAILNRQMLQRFLLSDFEEFEGQEVYIQNLESLNISFDGRNDVDLDQIDELNVAFSGDLRVVWRVNEEQLRVELAGLDASGVDQFSLENENIDHIEYDLSPFWARSLPNESRIDVEVVVGVNGN